MQACQRVLLVNPLLLLVCLFVCASYVCISLCSSFYLPSIHLSDIPSVCMSVCMYARMYLCKSNVLVYVLWISKIELTDALSGLSLHWKLISFGCFFRVAVQTTMTVCVFFMQSCINDRQKKYTYILNYKRNPPVFNLSQVPY